MSAAAPATGAPAKGRKSVHRDRGARIGRFVVIVVVLGWLFLPLIAALEFSTRGPRGERTLEYWAAIFSSQDLVAVVGLSLAISLFTVLGLLVLLATTMTWSYLRVPRARRLIEFVCLLPLAIPAVVLVVGVAPIYREIRVNFSSSPLMLALIYLVLVLPYAYRSIDGGLRSVDVATLADAARSLGAGWPRVMFQIIFPNIRTSLLSAAVLSVALVMGEYTISSLLSYRTFQVVLYALGKRDGSIAVAVSLAALVFVVLFAINYFGTARRRTQAAEEE